MTDSTTHAPLHATVPFISFVPLEGGSAKASEDASFACPTNPTERPASGKTEFVGVGVRMRRVLRKASSMICLAGGGSSQYHKRVGRVPGWQS